MPWGALAPLPLRLGGAAEDGWSTEQHARLCADLVALKRGAAFARWTYDQTGDETVVISGYVGQNGVGFAYAPDVVTINDDNDISFQWTSTHFEDDYGVRHSIKFRHALAQAHHEATSPTNKAHVQLIARGVRVRVVNASGNLEQGIVSVILR